MFVESIKGSLKPHCQTKSINIEESLLHIGRRDINVVMTHANDQELYNNAMVVASFVGSVKGSLKPHLSTRNWVEHSSVTSLQTTAIFVRAARCIILISLCLNA